MLGRHLLSQPDLVTSCTIFLDLRLQAHLNFVLLYCMKAGAGVYLTWQVINCQLSQIGPQFVCWNASVLHLTQLGRHPQLFLIQSSTRCHINRFLFTLVVGLSHWNVNYIEVREKIIGPDSWVRNDCDP